VKTRKGNVNNCYIAYIRESDHLLSYFLNFKIIAASLPKLNYCDDEGLSFKALNISARIRARI